MRAALSLLVALALLGTPLAASAAPPEDGTKDAARKIAQEGLDLYDGGKYQEALDRFVRAEALVHAPTMLLMAARALQKLGRLVEAADKYSAASQMLLDATASEAFRQAVADAIKERAALMARIPSVVVKVEAPPGAAVAVSIDGEVIPTTMLDQKRYMDPGEHTLSASSDGAVNTLRVNLKEGESRVVQLDLGTGRRPHFAGSNGGLHHAGRRRRRPRRGHRDRRARDLAERGPRRGGMQEQPVSR